MNEYCPSENASGFFFVCVYCQLANQLDAYRHLLYWTVNISAATQNIVTNEKADQQGRGGGEAAIVPHVKTASV